MSKDKLVVTKVESVTQVLQALQQNHGFDESQIKTDEASLKHWGRDLSLIHI